MNSKQILALAVAALFSLSLAGEVMARSGVGPGVSSTRVTRPAGSQRRDGTFLSTGTTANGSTTRPGRGLGLQDGSCRTLTPPAPTPSK